MTTLSISFNVDSQGFLSQECPTCERRFKTQIGKGSDKPVSHCPYCNHVGTSCWWTKEQAEYIGGVAARDIIDPQLDDIARSFNRGGGGGLFSLSMSVKKSRRPSAPPTEPEDEAFVTAVFDCCGEKIRHESGESRVYCVICGSSITATA